MRKVLLLVCVLLLCASTSFAGIMYDVTTTAGLQSVNLTAGQKTAVSLQLWVTLTGADADANNDGLSNGYVNILAANSGLTGVVGASSFNRGTAWRGTGSSNGTAQDLNGDGIKDIGSNGVSASGQITYVPTSLPVPNYGGGQNNILPGTPVGTGGMKYLLGTFSYTFDATNGVGGGGTLTIKPSIPTFVDNPKAIWYQDNPNYDTLIDDFPDVGGPCDPAYKMTTTGSALSVGPGVTLNLVPEPSTFVLLGLSALALVFIRRK